MELNQLTAHELLEKLKSHQTTSREILESLYARIHKVEPKVKAYVRLDEPRPSVRNEIWKEGRGEPSPSKTSYAYACKYNKFLRKQGLG